MAKRAEIGIGIDQATIKREAAAAGKLFGGEFVKDIEAMAEGAVRRLSDALGPDFAKSIDLKGLQQNFQKQFVDIAKSKKFKDAGALVSSSLSDAMSDGMKSAFDPKELNKAVTRGLESAERDTMSKTKRQGFINRLLWGEKGPKGTEREVRDSMAAISFQMTMSTLFGKAGAVIGGVPANIKRFGTGRGLAMTGLQAGLGVAAGALGVGGQEEGVLAGFASKLGIGVQGGRRGSAQGMINFGRSAKFSPGETAGILSPLLQGGGAAGYQTAIRAQRGLGMGGDITDLLSAVSQRGGRVTKESAALEMQKAVGIGVATGLTQGRWGEIARGMAQMVRGGGLGMAAMTGDITRVVSRIGLEGRPGGFRGAEAFEAVQGMERAMRSPRTALGRAVAMQVAGLGQHGDIFRAERQAELGFFGKMKLPGGRTREGAGEEGIQQMLDAYKRTFGLTGNVGDTLQDRGAEIRRGALIKEMSLNMGITQSATEKLLATMEDDSHTSEDIKKIIESGKTAEEQAYKAMKDIPKLKGIGENISAILSNIYTLLEPAVKNIEIVSREISQSLGGTIGDVRAERRLAAGDDARGSALYEQTKVSLQKQNLALARSAAAGVAQSTAERFGGISRFGNTEFSDIPGLKNRLRGGAIAEYYSKTGSMPSPGAKGLEQLRDAGVAGPIARNLLNLGGLAPRGFTKAELQAAMVEILAALKKRELSVTIVNNADVESRVNAAENAEAAQQTGVGYGG